MTNSQIYGWIFLSISEQPASLQDVIAMADGINHAIPTQKELQMSFGWLQAQGLMKKAGKKYSLTETGLALRKSLSGKTMMRIWDAATARFSQMLEVAVQPDDVSDAEVHTAYKAYKKQFWKEYKRLSGC